MSLLGKFFKRDNSVSSVTIPPEIYESVHVMRDDVNEMEGKPKESFPGADGQSNPSQSDSPFLGWAPAAPSSKSGDGTPSDGSFFLQKKGKVLIFGGIGILVLTGGAFATYLFFFSGSDSNENVAPILPQPDTGVITEASLEEPLAVSGEFFLTNMPNYIQIDPESDTATPDGIFMKLADTASKVRAMNTSDPVEFLIRDMNNNPIAFSRLAYLAKLAIPEDVLALIDESFSLLLIMDGGEIRFALVLEAKDVEGLADEVTAKESSLPNWFGRLFYNPSVKIPAVATFRSGAYGTVATKFAIVDEAMNYSFDYAFIGKKWVIGTSKDSFRFALEEVAMEPVK